MTPTYTFFQLLNSVDSNSHLPIQICDWILETDHNVTQGKVHFIVPANSHTHALPMHSVFARLRLKLTGLLFQRAFC